MLLLLLVMLRRPRAKLLVMPLRLLVMLPLLPATLLVTLLLLLQATLPLLPATLLPLPVMQRRLPAKLLRKPRRLLSNQLAADRWQRWNGQAQACPFRFRGAFENNDRYRPRWQVGPAGATMQPP